MLLDDDAWTFRCIGHRCSRALPSSEELGRNHTLRRLLEKAVVHRGIITENINQVAGLEQAYKAGYLISEMVDTDLVAYIFPTNLHERYASVIPGLR